MSWKEAVGQQIRDAREKADFSQETLAKAVGKSRQSIIDYEAGRATLSPDTLGRIAVELGMTEVNVNGYRFTIEQRTDQPMVARTEQLVLDFNREHIFPGGIIRVTATKTRITITASAPLRPAA